MERVLKFLGTLIKKIPKYLLVYIIIVTLVIGLVMNKKANFYKKNKDQVKLKTYNDRLALVDNMEDGMSFRVKLIEEAEESIDICYYLINNSNAGTIFLDELVKAADRGVKVRFITNKFNSSFRGSNKWREEILANHPNIEFYYYKNPWYNFYKIQDITHDKVIIADGKYLVTGGRNIDDRFYIKDDGMVDDLDILVERKSDSSSIDNYMAYYEDLLKAKPAKLVEASETGYDDLRENLKEALANTDKSIISKEDVFDRLKFRDVKMNFVHNSLDKVVKEPDILLYLGELNKNSSTTDWISPYVIPTKALVKLGNFDKKDPKINFYTNSAKSTPNYPGFGATLSYKSRTDKYGDMYSYKGQGSIHTKAVLYDDDVSAVGSFNLDPRSSYLSTETMAIVESEEFQEDLRNYLETRDMTTWDEAKKDKPPMVKSIALFIVRIFMYYFSPIV